MQYTFLKMDNLMCHGKKSTGEIHFVNDNQKAMTAGLPAQYQDPGINSPKCNIVVINATNYTGASPAVTCQNINYILWHGSLSVASE